MTRRTRKPKPPENLYQRGTVWWIRYCIGGKKIRRSLGTSNLREAKRLRDQILVKRSAAAKFGIEDPKPPAPVRTFGQIAEMWLESRAADRSLSRNTLRGNRSRVRCVFGPAFGHLPIAMITAEHLERFIGDQRTRYARGTVANQVCEFKCIIRHAIKRGWHDGPNPFDRLDRLPTPGPGRDITLTEDDAARLLQALSGRLYYKSALALYTGLRWGEIHGLAWADLDLDGDPATLTVRRSYHGKPKNPASAATVPICDDAVALMRRWKAEQPHDLPWVFPTQAGTLPKARPCSECALVTRVAKTLGIEGHITPHVFRHTFGTWVYERTGDPKIVQRLMRHASFTTSMRYVHDRRQLAPVVNLLPNLTPRAGLGVI